MPWAEYPLGICCQVVREKCRCKDRYSRIVDSPEAQVRTYSVNVILQDESGLGCTGRSYILHVLVLAICLQIILSITGAEWECISGSIPDRRKWELRNCLLHQHGWQILWLFQRDLLRARKTEKEAISAAIPFQAWFQIESIYTVLYYTLCVTWKL